MYLLIAVWGSSSALPDLHAHEGIQRDEADDDAGRRLRCCIFIGIFATFNEAGLGTFDLPALYAYAKYGFDPTSRSGSSRCSSSAPAAWPASGRSTHGRPTATSSAPTAVSMLHAGVLMKLGAFGIIRLGIQLFPDGARVLDARPGDPGVDQRALRRDLARWPRRDFKYVIGYSSASATWATCSWASRPWTRSAINGAALQMFSHGVMTALMFSMVGAVYDQAHTRELAVFGGLAQKMPQFAIFFVIAGLTSVGLPGFSGFVAEFNIFVGTFQHLPVGGRRSASSAPASPRSTSSACWRCRFFGQLQRERWGGLKEMTKFEMAGGALLIVFILFMGLWPAPFVDRISPTIVNFCRGSDERRH